MQKVACIDVGLKRIGVAFLLSNIAMPQSPIMRKNRDQASSEVRNLLQEWGITTLVVGYPQDIDMQNRIKHFVGLINFCGEVYYQDEDFSSYEAKELTKSQFRHQKDGKLDSISAQLILQRWQDSVNRTLKNS